MYTHRVRNASVDAAELLERAATLLDRSTKPEAGGAYDVEVRAWLVHYRELAGR
jgi:hypothetical protein